MSFEEFVARVKQDLAKRERHELDAMVASVLDHPSYAKRVGAAQAYRRAQDACDAVLDQIRRAIGDEGEQEDESDVA